MGRTVAKKWWCFFINKSLSNTATRIQICVDLDTGLDQMENLAPPQTYTNYRKRSISSNGLI